MAKGKTAQYYANNPKARSKRNKQQAEYNKTAKGLKIRTRANKLNRQLNTYGNRDGKDASHTGPNKGKLEKPSTNRRRPRLKIKYACCLLYTSPSPRDVEESRMPSSA